MPVRAIRFFKFAADFARPIDNKRWLVRYDAERWFVVGSEEQVRELRQTRGWFGLLTPADNGRVRRAALRASVLTEASLGPRTMASVRTHSAVVGSIRCSHLGGQDARTPVDAGLRALTGLPGGVTRDTVAMAFGNGGGHDRSFLCPWSEPRGAKRGPTRRHRRIGPGADETSRIHQRSRTRSRDAGESAYRALI